MQGFSDWAHFSIFGEFTGGRYLFTCLLLIHCLWVIYFDSFQESDKKLGPLEVIQWWFLSYSGLISIILVWNNYQLFKLDWTGSNRVGCSVISWLVRHDNFQLTIIYFFNFILSRTLTRTVQIPKITRVIRWKASPSGVKRQVIWLVDEYRGSGIRINLQVLWKSLFPTFYSCQSLW